MRLNETVLAAIAILAMSGGPVHGGGFETRDLTKVEAIVAAGFDDEAKHFASPESLNVICCGSEADQTVMVTLDRHTDEIGQGNRTDEAYIAELEGACRRFGCGIEEVDAGPATARLITIPRLGGGMKGANIFVVKDGDRLMIRSAAMTREIARENAQKTLDALKVPLIGG